MSIVDYNGFPIHRRTGTNLVSLTDMWKAQGSPANKKPRDWTRLEATVDLLQSMANQVGVTPTWGTKGEIKSVPGVLEVVHGGKAAGTYAIRELALDYAQFLSVEFHQWALSALVERIEEEVNPDLAIERGYSRAVRGWKRQGYSEEDIEVLVQSVITRKDFTETLKAHGVGQGRPDWVKNEHMAYAVATNEIYKPILPGTAKEYRQQNNLPTKANVRDHLVQTGNMTKRLAVALAETMAREKINGENRYGFTECKEACSDSGRRVARVFE